MLAEALTNTTVTDLECSSTDRCTATVGIISGQRQCAASHLLNCTCPADRSAEGYGVAPIERQGTVGGEISGNASARPTVTDLESSSTDRCTARVGIASGQRQRAASRLHQGTGPADGSAKGYGVAPIERQRTVGGDIPGSASALPTVTVLECAGTDRCAARVCIISGHRQRAASHWHQGAGPADRSAEGYGVAPIERQ